MCPMWPASFVFWGLLFSASLAAQQPPQRDPQGLQLVNQAYVAMGGPLKTKVTDVRVEGTLALASAPDSGVGTFVTKVRGLDISVDILLTGTSRSYRILKGQGSLRTNDKLKALPPYHTAGLSVDILPLFSRWTEFLQATTSISTPQPTDVDGLPCYLVHVESQDAFQGFWKNDHGKSDVLVDPRTGLVAGIRYHATQGQYATDSVTVENYFTEYHTFSGILVPTRITRYLHGQPVLVLHVKSVQFNNGFGDSDFHN